MKSWKLFGKFILLLLVMLIGNPNHISCRWLSVDPLTKDYPFLSPYNYAANNSIAFIDPDGGKIVPANAEIQQKLDNLRSVSKSFDVLYQILDAMPQEFRIRNLSVYEETNQGGKVTEVHGLFEGNLTGGKLVGGTVYVDFDSDYAIYAMAEELFHAYQYSQYAMEVTEKDVLNGEIIEYQTTILGRATQELEAEAKLFNTTVAIEAGEGVEDPTSGTGLLSEPSFQSMLKASNYQVPNDPNCDPSNLENENDLGDYYGFYLFRFSKVNEGNDGYSGEQRSNTPDAFNSLMKEKNGREKAADNSGK